MYSVLFNLVLSSKFLVFEMDEKEIILTFQKTEDNPLEGNKYIDLINRFNDIIKEF
jgi:hypothetical protein